MEINKNIYNEILIERSRLEEESHADYQDCNGMEANFIIKCSGNSKEVIKLARNTLLAVNYQYDKVKWPTLENWKNIIPTEFLINCENEKNENELTIYKKWWFNLSYKQKWKESRKKINGLLVIGFIGWNRMKGFGSGGEQKF